MKSEKDWIEKWVTDSELKEKFKQNLNASGYPLETRAKKKLNEEGYTAMSSFYVDKDQEKEKQKELDIFAFKQGKEVSIKNDSVSISLFLNCTIIGECKAPQNKELLVFELDRYKKGNLINLRIPLLGRSKHFIESTSDGCFSEDDKIFIF